MLQIPFCACNLLKVFIVVLPDRVGVILNNVVIVGVDRCLGTLCIYFIFPYHEYFNGGVTTDNLVGRLVYITWHEDAVFCSVMYIYG